LQLEFAGNRQRTGERQLGAARGNVPNNAIDDRHAIVEDDFRAQARMRSLRLASDMFFTWVPALPRMT
jgi:hypothetical protein